MVHRVTCKSKFSDLSPVEGPPTGGFHVLHMPGSVFSDLRDKHGHYVHLSEGARVQIHISIFLIFNPRPCWHPSVIPQLSAACREGPFRFPVIPVMMKRNRAEETHVAGSGQTERRGRARRSNGQVEGETEKTKSAFQIRVERAAEPKPAPRSRGVRQGQILMRTFFLITVKLQRRGGRGNDASLISTSLVWFGSGLCMFTVTITFSLSNLELCIHLLYKWGVEVRKDTTLPCEEVTQQAAA